MYCTECGEHNDDGANYCYACGARLSSPTAREELAEGPSAHNEDALDPADATQNSGTVPRGKTQTPNPERDRSLLRAINKQSPVKGDDPRIRSAAKREWNTGGVDEAARREAMRLTQQFGTPPEDAYVGIRAAHLDSLAGEEDVRGEAEHASPAPQRTDDSSALRSKGRSVRESMLEDHKKKEGDLGYELGLLLAGCHGLARTFWLWGFIPLLILNVVLSGIPYPVIVYVLPAVLCYKVFVIIAIWNAAGLYKGSVIWTILSRIWVALVALWGVAELALWAELMGLLG